MFKKLYGSEAETIIESGLTHAHALFYSASGLGTKISIKRLGSIKHYDKWLNNVDEAAMRSMMSVTRSNLIKADLMVYVTWHAPKHFLGMAEMSTACTRTHQRKQSINSMIKEYPHINGWVKMKSYIF